MDVEAVADELYGLDPADFIARRTVLAAEARTAGERELARTIATLRRPPLAAWLLNQLMRSEPDVLDGLSDFAQRIRHAHRALEGDQLRVLAGERQQVLDRVVDAVVGLATARDVSVTDAVRLQIRATAEAAIADEAAEAAVRSGRLTDVLSYSGFGEVDVSGAVAVGLPRRPRRPSTPLTRPSAVPDAVDGSPKRSAVSDRSVANRGVASDRSVANRGVASDRSVANRGVASDRSAPDRSAAQHAAARAEARAALDAEDLSIAAAESAAAAAERDDAERTFASATARLQELESAVVQARSALRAATSARTAATRKAERAELRRLALERRRAKGGG